MVKGVCGKGVCKFCSVKPYLEKNVLLTLYRTQTKKEYCFKTKTRGQAIKLWSKNNIERNESYFPCCHSSLSISHSLSLFNWIFLVTTMHHQSFSATWFLKGTFNYCLDFSKIEEFQIWCSSIFTCNADSFLIKLLHWQSQIIWFCWLAELTLQS